MRQMTLPTPEDGPTQPCHIDGIPRAWQGVARGWQQRHQAVPKSHRKVQCQGCVKGRASISGTCQCGLIALRLPHLQH